MFSGNYAVTLDDKGRMSIPAGFRKELREDHGSKVIVTYEVNDMKSLTMYTPNMWEEVSRKVQSLPNVGDSAKAGNTRWLQRALIGSARQLDIDDNGRILLPQEHRNKFNLKKKIRVIGQITKMEIWAEGAWEECFRDWEAKPDQDRLGEIDGLSL